jgi:hypothetical protein
MKSIDRRQLLKVAAAATAGLAAGAAGVVPAIAADRASAVAFPPGRTGRGTQSASGGSGFSGAPTPGVTYKYFRGQDFRPRASSSTFTWSSTGGEFYLTAGIDYVPCRLDLPQGSVVTEIRFDIFLTSADSQDFAFTTFAGPSDVNVDVLFTSYSTVSASVQTINPFGAFSPITIDNTTLSYVLYWRPGVTTGTSQLVGARVGYINGLPGLITFAAPARVYGAGVTVAAEAFVLNVNATTRVGGGASGIPAGAKAAFCAVQSYQPGVISLYPGGTADPGIANWSGSGTPGALQLLYMMVPLNAAGKFSMHNRFTDKQIYVDAWGYLI